MKKNLTIAAVVVLSATLFSCTKEESISSVLPPQARQAGPGTASTSLKVNAVSSWANLSFAPASNGRYSWIEASQPVSGMTGYDHNAHKQFAYIRLQGRDSYGYYALPAQINCSAGLLNFSYTLDDNNFYVKVINTTLSDDVVGASWIPANTRFRFIVVSDSTYSAHSNVNWNNYEEVAATLSSSISFQP